MKTTRRDFLRHASAAAAGSALATTLPLAATARPSANEQLNVALIGCRGIGWDNLRSMLKVPNVRCVGLCDVDQRVLDDRSKDFEELTGQKAPKHYRDFRKLLRERDLDAVIIATPDHWHALQTILALDAGKHVYVEKPLANSIEECKAMVAAQQRTGLVVQVGQQQRSSKHWQDAIAFVHSGELGRVRSVQSWAWLDWKGSVPHKPDQAAPPPGVDYDMWLGPAPKHAFNENRFHFTFRWFWEYAGGLMTDWGVHMIDMVLYGMKAGGPNAVMSAGGKYAYPDDAMRTPDTLNAVYEFDDFLMSWNHTIGLGRGPYDKDHGVAFHGETATLVVNRRGWEVIPEYDRNSRPRVYQRMPVPLQTPNGNDRDAHTLNFVNAVREGEKLNCDLATGANTAINAHLGNIAYRLGKKVYWDKDKQRFKDDPEAQALASVEYRRPWKLPKS
ncbi:MAG: Gfo/Idh/MocA family oxidoreductase [Catalinimonas sp.]